MHFCLISKGFVVRDEWKHTAHQVTSYCERAFNCFLFVKKGKMQVNVLLRSDTVMTPVKQAPADWDAGVKQKLFLNSYLKSIIVWSIAHKYKNYLHHFNCLYRGHDSWQSAVIQNVVERCMLILPCAFTLREGDNIFLRVISAASIKT